MCGGICKHAFIENLLLSLSVKIFFENRLTFGEVMAKSLVSCFFVTHNVVHWQGWFYKNHV